MTAFSNFLENELLDHVLKGASYTPPTDVFIALFTSAPSDSGGGTEVSGGAYARFTVNDVANKFKTAVAGATENNEEWAFAVATANWGTITHVGVFDALTAGNLLFHGALTASKAINTNDQFKFAVGDFDISLD